MTNESNNIVPEDTQHPQGTGLKRTSKMITY